jgi:hypothetical protein
LEREEALMKIGVIGAGHIGGNCARQGVKGGHEVKLSFSRDRSTLEELAAELGARASVGGVREAVEFGGVVIDTTNQFGSGPKPAPGQTAASFNAGRMPGARYTKSFNTLTAGFQVMAAERNGDATVVQWVCGDDADANRLVAQLIESMGYAPVDLGGTETCHVMEAPRRPGSVYGEEYRRADAQSVVDAVAQGKEIPPTPKY